MWSVILQTSRLLGGHSMSAGWRPAPSVIEHLQLLDPDNGTVFHRT